MVFFARSRKALKAAAIAVRAETGARLQVQPVESTAALCPPRRESAMQIEIENTYQFTSELRRKPDIKDRPISSVDVTADIAALIDETYTHGVLADCLPEQSDLLRVRIEPHFSESPRVERIDVHLTAGTNGSTAEFTQQFRAGPWNRSEQRRMLQLREEGTLAEGDTAYRMLLALPSDAASIEAPSLQPPAIIDGTLEEFGFRELGAGELIPDRPLLANQRLVEDSIEACLARGSNETGGGAIGLNVRLKEPLPHTTTRIVQILTAYLEDRRHTGKLNEWKISNEALAEAAEVCALRGMGERVMTVVHTHGWSTECGNCNTNANCPLAECTLVSLLDYQVLETLFPSKSTVMPIAGRKLGAEGKRPVLEIHAWRGGEMRPIRWQRYRD